MGTNLTMMSDILFPSEVDPGHLRVAVSRAFAIAPDLVAVADLSGIDPVPDDVSVVMLREPEDMPGDFPVWYGLAVDPALVDRVPRVLDAMVKTLGIASISDADDDEDMTLHLPDGSGHVVHLVQDDDDAFRITPEMRQLIEAATRWVADSAEGSGHDPDAHLTRKAIAG